MKNLMSFNRNSEWHPTQYRPIQFCGDGSRISAVTCLGSCGALGTCSLSEFVEDQSGTVWPIVRIDSTTSGQIRELRLCDVFESVDLSTACPQGGGEILGPNQVLRKALRACGFGLCLMKNTFQYSQRAFGVIYTDCRGSGRGMSRGAPHVMFCCTAIPQIN